MLIHVYLNINNSLSCERELFINYSIELVLSLAKNDIAYNPQIPTIAYITLETADILPNSDATRSKLKKPISPQFTAPIITKISASVSNVFINTHSFLIIYNYYFNHKKNIYVFMDIKISRLLKRLKITIEYFCQLVEKVIL